MNTAAPTPNRRPPSLGARLLILVGVSIGLMLLNTFVSTLVPVDDSAPSPTRDTVVNIIHSVVYFGATVSYWALFAVLVFMIVRWTLGAPIIDALRS